MPCTAIVSVGAASGLTAIGTTAALYFLRPKVARIREELLTIELEIERLQEAIR
jgi:hypothetical protein